MNTNEKPIEIAVRILNEAIKLDPKAMNDLFRHRVYCNDKLAEHPTIQVKDYDTPFGKGVDVGVVGMLNGVLEAMTGEKLASQAEYSEKDKKWTLLGFQVINKMNNKKEDFIIVSAKGVNVNVAFVLENLENILDTCDPTSHDTHVALRKFVNELRGERFNKTSGSKINIPVEFENAEFGEEG